MFARSQLTAGGRRRIVPSVDTPGTPEQKSEVYGNLESYDFCARTVAQLDARGLSLIGIGDFWLKPENAGFRVCVPALEWKGGGQPGGRYVPYRKPSQWTVTREQVIYALDNGQFARIRHETLQPPVRTKKSKKK